MIRLVLKDYIRSCLLNVLNCICLIPGCAGGLNGPRPSLWLNPVFLTKAPSCCRGLSGKAQQLFFLVFKTNRWLWLHGNRPHFNGYYLLLLVKCLLFAFVSCCNTNFLRLRARAYICCFQFPSAKSITPVPTPCTPVADHRAACSTAAVPRPGCRC